MLRYTNVGIPAGVQPMQQCLPFHPHVNMPTILSQNGTPCLPFSLDVFIPVGFTPHLSLVPPLEDSLRSHCMEVAISQTTKSLLTWESNGHLLVKEPKPLSSLWWFGCLRPDSSCQAEAVPTLSGSLRGLGEGLKARCESVNSEAWDLHPPPAGLAHANTGSASYARACRRKRIIPTLHV